MSKKKRDVSYSLYYWVIGVLGVVLVSAFVMSFFIKEEFRLSPPISSCSESTYLSDASFITPVYIEYFPATQKLLVTDSSAKTINLYRSDRTLEFTLPGTYINPRFAGILSNTNYLVGDNGILNEVRVDGSIVWSSSESSLLSSYPFGINSVYILDDLNYFLVYPNNIVKYHRGVGDDPELISWDYSPVGGEEFVDVELVSNNLILVVDKQNKLVYDVNGESGVTGDFVYRSSGVPYDVEKQSDDIIILEDTSPSIIKTLYSDPTFLDVYYISTSMLNPRSIQFYQDFLVADSGNKRILSVDCTDQTPTADAGGPWTVLEGKQVEFDGTESTDTDGEIRTYTWEVDGAIVGSGPTYLYTANKPAGTYTVVLTVTDDDGLTDTDSNLLTVSEDIACGDTFSSGTHTLTEDLTCTSTGLIITGSDVTLDCGWHRITGTSLNSILHDVGIWVKSTGTDSLKRVTIKNCELTGFDTGVLLDHVDNSFVTNAYILDSNEFGVRLINSNDNTISGGIRDGEQKGILLNLSSYNDLTFKEINRTKKYYIELNVSDGNVIHDSKLESFDDDAVDLILLQDSLDNQFNAVSMYVEGRPTGVGVRLMDSDDNGFDRMIFENLATGVSVLDDAERNVFTSGDWMTNNSVDLHSDDAVTNFLVDPDLIDPATDKRTGTFEYAMDDGMFDVRWYLGLSSEDKYGNDLSGADIGVYTVSNTPIYGKLSDTNGKVPLLNFSEYTIEADTNDVDITVYTPHTLSAYYGGVNYTSVKNISKLGSFVFTFNVTANPNDDNPDTGDDCVPDWVCSDWGSCINGLQTKTCTDNNLCGTSNGMPLTSQSCTVTGQDPYTQNNDPNDLTSDPNQDSQNETSSSSLDTVLIYYIIIPLLIVGIITFGIYWYRTRGGRRSTGFVVQSSSREPTSREEPLSGDEAKVYSFVKEARGYGYTDDKIRDALLDKGWDPRLVDKAMQRRL